MCQNFYEPQRMSRKPRIRWLTYGAALFIVAIVIAGVTRTSSPDSAAYTPQATALGAPAQQLPSPVLATAGLALELPATELGTRSPRSGQATRSTDPLTVGTRTISTAASRARVIELCHANFAADNLAARAGLLSSRTTAPPPHLG